MSDTGAPCPSCGNAPAAVHELVQQLAFSRRMIDRLMGSSSIPALNQEAGRIGVGSSDSDAVVFELHAKLRRVEQEKNELRDQLDALRRSVRSLQTSPGMGMEAEGGAGVETSPGSGVDASRGVLEALLRQLGGGDADSHLGPVPVPVQAPAGQDQAPKRSVDMGMTRVNFTVPKSEKEDDEDDQELRVRAGEEFHAGGRRFIPNPAFAAAPAPAASTNTGDAQSGSEAYVELAALLDPTSATASAAAPAAAPAAASPSMVICRRESDVGGRGSVGVVATQGEMIYCGCMSYQTQALDSYVMDSVSVSVWRQADSGMGDTAYVTTLKANVMGHSVPSSEPLEITALLACPVAGLGDRAMDTDTLVVAGTSAGHICMWRREEGAADADFELQCALSSSSSNGAYDTPVVSILGLNDGEWCVISSIFVCLEGGAVVTLSPSITVDSTPVRSLPHVRKPSNRERGEELLSAMALLNREWDDSLLLIAVDVSIEVRSATRGDLVRTLESGHHRSMVTAVAANDERMVVTGDKQGHIVIWDTSGEWESIQGIKLDVGLPRRPGPAIGRGVRLAVVPRQEPVIFVLKAGDFEVETATEILCYTNVGGEYELVETFRIPESDFGLGASGSSMGLLAHYSNWLLVWVDGEVRQVTI